MAKVNVPSCGRRGVPAYSLPLRPPPVPVLEQFRQTKLYDLLAAFPLILFYAFAVAGLMPRIAAAFWSGSPNLAVVLNALSLLGIACFATLQIVLFLVRRVPMRF